MGTAWSRGSADAPPPAAGPTLEEAFAARRVVPLYAVRKNQKTGAKVAIYSWDLDFSAPCTPALRRPGEAGGYALALRSGGDDIYCAGVSQVGARCELALRGGAHLTEIHAKNGVRAFGHVEIGGSYRTVVVFQRQAPDAVAYRE